MTRLLACLVLLLTACVGDSISDPPPDHTGDSVDAGAAAVCTPLTTRFTALGCDEADVELFTDYCDDRAYLGGIWLEHTSDHFVFHYLQDTAAERDLTEIVATRERAYAAIRSRLSISAEPTIAVYLSPNRIAATIHSLGTGVASPGADRYEVIYTGAVGSYETTQYGHELTLTLAYHIDPAHWMRLGLFSQGLAEYLDQSDRNLHAVHASQLLSARETRVRVGEFEDRDLWGSNRARAGSLVKFLVERYGMATFRDLYKAAYLEWSGGCYGHPTYGCGGSAATLPEYLDKLLRQKTGERWVDIQPIWEDLIQRELQLRRIQLSVEDRLAIEQTLRVMDTAITNNDDDQYRSAMEGFYCDWGGEQQRSDIAYRTVHAIKGAQTTVVDIYATGIKNFPGARALVVRRDDAGNHQLLNIDLEKLPEGWRATWSPDWY